MNKMKRIFIIAFVTAVVWSASWFLFWSIKAKSKYDKVKDELSKKPYTLVEIGKNDKKFLKEIKKEWHIHLNIINGATSKALKLIGFDNSVSGITKLLTYEMPSYSWLSSEQNKKVSRIAIIYTMLAPRSVDNIIHVAKDRNLAFTQFNEGFVLVYQNDETGLREIQYVKEHRKNKD